MKGSIPVKYIFWICVAVFLSSCENFDLFQSEDTLNERIQKRWTLVPIPADKPKEYWTFNDGIIYREKVDPSSHVYDTGSYSISTSMTGAVLDIRDFTHPDSLIAPWDIVRLDDDILFIATDQNGYSGVTQREFYIQ